MLKFGGKKYGSRYMKVSWGQLAPLNENVNPPAANFAALALLLGTLGLVHLHRESNGRREICLYVKT